MPVVPTYRNFAVTPTASAPQFAEPDNAQQVEGRQLQQTGAALQDAGGATHDVALDMQRTIDQVKVNDAINQARGVVNNLTYDPQVGYKAQKGNAALTRDSGKFLPDEFGEKLDSAIANIAQTTLQTDQQRQVFAEHAAATATAFRADVQAHTLQEFQNYRVSTNDGTIDLAQDEAKHNWNDPSKIGPSLDAAKAAVYDKGQTLGWSPSQIDAAVLKTTSEVHRSVVMSALQNNNPDYAFAYLNRYKSEMSGDDILRVSGQVNESVYMNQALSAVQAASTKARSVVAPNNFDRMAAITMQTESGGKRFGPDGQTLLTSSAGAKGEMQVLDSTMRSPGLGLTPLDPATATPDQRAQFGRDYLQALLQKYGDPAKAWAAYNAGPGRVDSALAQAAKSGGDWQALLPPETQAYVKKNVAVLGGTNTPSRMTEGDFVASALGNLPTGAPPQVIARTREQAISAFGVITKTLNEQADNAVASAQRWIAQNNGNFNGLPPDLRDAVTRAAPGRLDDLIRYARSFDRGENVTDLVLYNRMAAHPEELGRLTDTQFESLRPQLSSADFKHFSNERSNWVNGKVDESAGAINTPALNQVLNSNLEALQIRTTPAAGDLNGRERLGGLQKFVRESIFEAQRQAGKKFTPAEIQDHVNGLFARNVSFRQQLFGVIPVGSTDPTPVLALQVSDLPSDTVTAIKGALAKQGRTNPTNTDVISVYRRWRLSQPAGPNQAPPVNLGKGSAEEDDGPLSGLRSFKREMGDQLGDVWNVITTGQTGMVDPP